VVKLCSQIEDHRITGNDAALGRHGMRKGRIRAARHDRRKGDGFRSRFSNEAFDLPGHLLFGPARSQVLPNVCQRHFRHGQRCLDGLNLAGFLDQPLLFHHFFGGSHFCPRPGFPQGGFYFPIPGEGEEMRFHPQAGHRQLGKELRQSLGQAVGIDGELIAPSLVGGLLLIAEIRQQELLGGGDQQIPGTFRQLRIDGTVAAQVIAILRYRHQQRVDR